MTCLICNLAISGTLTWSWIPICSIIFAWIVLFPGMILRKRRILASLISLSVFLLPYLFLLRIFTGVKEVFTIGAVMSLVSIVFLWIIAAIFDRLGTRRRSAAFGITFLSGIPFVFMINAILSRMINEPAIDRWDILSVFILLILAFISFALDYAKKGLR